MPKQRNDPPTPPRAGGAAAPEHQPPEHHQAGEYGEGDEQQATGVGPRSPHSRPQVIDDSRGYADTYGNVEPGRYGVYGYSSSPGYPGPDERLRELIRERLTEDPGINASDVTIEVSAGRVTLSGSVDSNRARHEVEQCVENCGARDVQNDLQITP